MSLSQWQAVFTDCLQGRDLDRMARASVAFDYRQVAGELRVDLALTDIMREAPSHPRFLKGLSLLGSKMRVPLGFRQRLEGRLDIKKDGLIPIQNLARYHAFARGITAPSTLERLEAVREACGDATTCEQSLREAFISISDLQEPRVMPELQLGDADERLAQRLFARGGVATRLAHRLQALEGARRGDPPGEGVVARQVLDGDEPVLLDVEAPFEPLPEPQRHAYLRAQQREALEEARVTRGLAHDVGQRQVHAQLAGDLTVVERHARARHPVEVASLKAVGEDRLQG